MKINIIIRNPFAYVCSSLNENHAKLVKELGTTEQWTALVPLVSVSDGTLEGLITSGLNLIRFDPYQTLGTWDTLESWKKWLLKLWYTLGLKQESNYISYAMTKVNAPDEVVRAIECAIIDCVENPNFDEWWEQRKSALDALKIKEFSQAFWDKYDTLSDARIKIKILTGKTHTERAKIIELLSHAFSHGQ